MNSKKNTIRFILILLLPFSIGLVYISSMHQNIVEKIYTGRIYRSIIAAMNAVLGRLPFSFAETILIIFSLAAIFYIALKLVCIIKRKSFRLFGDLLLNILSAISVIYFLFIILWGLNYYRLPYSKIAGLDVRPASVSELRQVCGSLIDRANTLREKVHQNGKGCMYIYGGYKSAFKRAHTGFDNASKTNPKLFSLYGFPKPVLLSKLMSYTGITGVYFPYTGEANVNIDQPDSMILSTACHEMAHQRGFAREDEANYISYFVCMQNPDADFQYSGVLLALINSMNALYTHDKKAYLELTKKYSSGLIRDLKQNNLYWKKHEGNLQKISDRINDAYLKSNMQNDGVYSYGRMVDLIIAEYRKSR
mgnify:CR=1 FL=1